MFLNIKMCDLEDSKNSLNKKSILKSSYAISNSKLDSKNNLDIFNSSKKDALIEMIKETNPQFLENFEITDYIGSGRNGYVLKGKYKINKKVIALKFLPIKENIKNLNIKNSRIIQEMTISEKLHHVNILETYAHLNINPFLYVSILEYGKNGDLDFFVKYLLHRKFISETALNYFSFQILEGLQYLHKSKIIHMDIKPVNIIIDSSLCAKIADYGVSCSYANFEPNNLVKFPFVGTSKCMSPEIIRKDNIKVKYSEKIDIYSFGVTLYFLFFGIFPYKLNDIKGKDYDKILKNIENENLEFPKERKISNLFKNFLEKLLDKNYIKRIGIKEALNHPWIKASKAIFDEKENLGCLENFLVKLITDNIPNFNELIK